MYLETTSPSNEEDLSAVRLHTPPGVPLAVPSGSSAISRVPRELLVDASCLQSLRAAYGHEPEAFRIITIDVGRLLSSGTASTLAKSAAIVMAPTGPAPVTVSVPLERM